MEARTDNIGHPSGRSQTAMRRIAVGPLIAVQYRAVYWPAPGATILLTGPQPHWATQESVMGEPLPGTPPSLSTPEDRLDSWKEIATYLNRDVTTVQRWERREEMPVHRHQHDKMGSVYASRAELDAWVKSRKLRPAQDNGNDLHALNSQPPVATAVPRAQANWRIWTAVIAAAMAAVLLLAWFANHRASRASSSPGET